MRGNEQKQSKAYIQRQKKNCLEAFFFLTILFKLVLLKEQGKSYVDRWTPRGENRKEQKIDIPKVLPAQ